MHRAAGSPHPPRVKCPEIALARCPFPVPIINNAWPPPGEGFGVVSCPRRLQADRTPCPRHQGRRDPTLEGDPRLALGSRGTQPVALGRAGESRRLRDARRSPPGWEGAGWLARESVLMEIALPQWRTHGCGAVPAARLLRPAAFRGQRRALGCAGPSGCPRPRSGGARWALPWPGGILPTGSFTTS